MDYYTHRTLDRFVETIGDIFKKKTKAEPNWKQKYEELKKKRVRALEEKEN